MSEVDDKLETLAEEFDTDIEAVRNIYEEKLEAIKEADVIGVSEDDFADAAVKTTRSRLQSNQRTGFVGEAEELPILAIGQYGVFDTWGKNNDNVMVGLGVIAPEDTEDENRPAGLAVFIMNESRGIDLGRAEELFQWGNHIRGWFSIEKLTEDFAGRARTYYRADTTDNSKLEEADFEGALPEDPEAIRSFLAENFVKEDFSLANVAEALTMEGEEFGSNWADIRRFEGQVVDFFKRTEDECEPDQNAFGKYVLIDDSVASHEELEANRDLVSEDDAENGRTAGLQVFIEPHMIQWGEDSTVEVYGTVTRDDREDGTGQITMRAAGVAPVIPFPLQDDSGGDSDDTEEEPL